jgi:prepilin signal peptidase PulO-like enzyme (type II secretory pathway)
MTWLFASYVFAIGAIIGSFLNVVIHRYPREESIVFPPSAPIEVRYPLVELANAPSYVAILQRTGFSWGLIPIARWCR